MRVSLVAYFILFFDYLCGAPSPLVVSAYSLVGFMPGPPSFSFFFLACVRVDRGAGFLY
jgi:hypothetical protein